MGITMKDISLGGAGGPGWGEQLISYLLTAAASAAASVSALQGHEGTVRAKKKAAENKKLVGAKRQNQGIMTARAEQHGRAKDVALAREKYKSGSWTQLESQLFLEDQGVHRSALEQGGWAVGSASKPQIGFSGNVKRSGKKTIRGKGKAPAGERFINGAVSVDLTPPDDSYLSEEAFEGERFVNGTVFIDPTSSDDSYLPDEPPSRAFGVGFLVFIVTLVSVRVSSAQIRKHKNSNKMAAWLDSSFSPASERLVDISTKTDASLKVLNQKLDNMELRDEEILKLLKSLNNKL